MNLKKVSYLSLLMCFILLNHTYAQDNKNGQSIKVDFDFSQRKLEEVHDPSYLSWTIEEGRQTKKSFGDVNFKITGDFNSKWYKVGVQAPFYARLISDGLMAEGPLEFTINGLSPGEHSLLTFHNTFDSPEQGDFTPINVYVNGKLVEKGLKPTTRSETTIEAAMSYVTFNAEQGKDVAIRFEADPNSSAPNKEIVINGFELDSPNMKLQARLPDPENKDEHVVTEDGELVLKWDASDEAVSHDVYFGKDKNAVASADHNATEFKVNSKSKIYNVDKLYSMETYYWRIDEIAADGTKVKGDIWSFRPAHLAFPGAEGYGRFAIGGRGGKVVEVTNLNDSGPGSLREALTNDIGSRTVVFTVSGNIDLKSRLVANQPYVTVAGQTAPGEGITITRAPIGLTGDDGVMRFLRVRIGAGRTFDGMGLTGADYSIIDHCSISWTIDESFSSRGAHHITLQRTLISEALNVANHHKYKKGKMHGYAATIGGDIGSFHHNLLAHNYGRNWSVGGGLNGDGYYSGRVDIRNNVVYNWGHRATDGGAKEIDFVNNYYKPGPSTNFFYALNMQHEGVGLGSQRAYFSGNVMTGYFDEDNQEEGRKMTITNNEKVDYETFVDKPFFKSYVTTQTARGAYKNVLSDVGMNQPYFDKHDQRIVQETIDSTYHFKGSRSGLAGMIDTQKDVGGFPAYPREKRHDDWDTDHDGLPNWWEKEHKLNPNSAKGDFSDANNDEDRNGYTQLEEYLDWMATPHYFSQSGENITINLENLFEGYIEQPVYSVSEIENNKINLENNNLEFKGSKSGLTSFQVSVKDVVGDSMTRTINVFVQ